MSGKHWITGIHFDASKVSFSGPEDIGNRYIRYNVRYMYDDTTVKGLYLTTNTVNDFVTCLGIRPDTGKFAKPNSHQATIVLNRHTESHAQLYKAIVEIVAKFKSEVIPDHSDLKCPVNELDDGSVKIYTRPIQSNSGKIYTVIQNKEGDEIPSNTLETVFECRPSLSINFVVGHDTATMKIQIARMYVARIVEKVNINLADVD